MPGAVAARRDGCTTRPRAPRPSGTGTVVTQWARLGYGPSGMHYGIKANPDKEELIVDRRLEQWRGAMRATLELIKERAETP